MGNRRVYLSASNQEANLGADGVTEEVRMQLLARDVGAILEQRGVTVYYNDPSWTLSQIVNDSNARQPDLHIAIHSNAGGGSGTETWCYGVEGTDSAKFGALLQAALVGALGLPDRGIKDSLTPGHRWAEVVQTRATAVLTEVMFHDTLADIQVFNHTYLQVVNAMANVIGDWLDGVGETIPQTQPVLSDIEVLRQAGVINSPDYWVSISGTGQPAQCEYVDALIRNMADYVRRSK